MARVPSTELQRISRPLSRRKTKIVCTLGPAVDSVLALRALMEAGMNVARFNCSHGSWATKKEWARWIRLMNPICGPVAVLVDLQGPKIRLDSLPENELMLAQGSLVKVGLGKNVDVPISHKGILAVLRPGERVLIGDGHVELRITQGEGGRFQARVVAGGTIRSKQGVTVVNRTIDELAITEKDREDLEHAMEIDADFIALSYCRRPEDVLELRSILQRNKKNAHIIPKIETREAVQNIEKILAVSDGIMIARGDLGLQVELEEVPLIQKRLIRAAREAGKPVITATQMLESMIDFPRPTRAEVADVANAILDGTDAVMLSAETAIGKYPTQAVRTMASIAEYTEPEIDREAIFRELTRSRSKIDSTEAVAAAVAQLVASVSPRAVVTSSSSGQTPRLVSRFRLKPHVLCTTWNPKTQNQLAIVYGVEAVFMPLPLDTEAVIINSIQAFRQARRLKRGDSVVITAGVPPGKPGSTNLILNYNVR